MPSPARLPFAAACLLLLARPVAAQSEAALALSQYFEGRTVVVAIDMPATEKGIDVFPAEVRPLDYPAYAKRLKQFGTAIHNGESAMVTKVKVKGDLIEFQLGGGGYGTFGDDDGGTVFTPAVSKSKREQYLERAVRVEKDPEKKRQFELELDDLRRAREREDRRNQAAAAAATEARRANVQQRRLAGGSRFNLRFRGGVPEEALSPEAIQSALAEYLRFPPDQFGGAVPVGPAPAVRPGMTLSQVEDALGPPVTSSERAEGTLTVVTRSYGGGRSRVLVEFVRGIAIGVTGPDPR